MTTEMSKQKNKKKPGRPTKYDPKIASDICIRMAAGESVRGICKDANMPCFRTVMGWAHDQNQPAYKAGFPVKYQAAMQSMAQNMFDELLEIADDDTCEAQRSRIMVDTRKWYLSKCLPKVFGDKLNLDHSGEIGLRVIPDDELDARLTAIQAELDQLQPGSKPPDSQDG
jgi:hypothetical protein